ncbi:MAG: pyruvate kinase, partial [Clostridia bacterium]|nr:pyruvate kinase [Clostridia bacterium]
MRKTKIVATIGPACRDEVLLIQMIQAGLDVARFNFSHGTHSEHESMMNEVWQAAQKAGKAIALMLDTKGPEIRLGILADGHLTLATGQEIDLNPEASLGNKTKLPISYAGLAKEVQTGDRILLADGLIELKVLQTQGQKIKCRVENGGKIRSRQGVNVPGIRLGLPAVSEQDREDLLFGVEQGIDLVAASFTRRPEDIREIRAILKSRGSSAQIIAKIENREGLDNLEAIVAEADGIMVARGDLGVE